MFVRMFRKVALAVMMWLMVVFGATAGCLLVVAVWMLFAATTPERLKLVLVAFAIAMAAALVTIVIAMLAIWPSVVYRYSVTGLDRHPIAWLHHRAHAKLHGRRTNTIPVISSSVKEPSDALKG